MKSAPKKVAALNAEARRLMLGGRPKDGLLAARKAYALAQAHLPPEDPEARESARQLGLLLFKLGQREEALRLMGQHGLEAEEGTSPAYEIDALNMQVISRLQSPNRKGVREQAARALERARRELEPDDPILSVSLGNMAQACEFDGLTREAEQLYRECAEVRRRGLGADHPAVAAALNDLAELYTQQDRFDEAEALYEEALAIKRRGLPPRHPSLATTMANMARVHSHKGRLAEAEALLLQALDIKKEALGPDHPEVGPTMHGLAHLYGKMEQWDRAVDMMGRLARLWDRGLGPDHPMTIQAWNEYGVFLLPASRFEEAEEAFGRVVRMAAQRFGESSHEATEARKNLARAGELRASGGLPSD